MSKETELCLVCKEIITIKEGNHLELEDDTCVCEYCDWTPYLRGLKFSSTEKHKPVTTLRRNRNEQ